MKLSNKIKPWMISSGGDLTMGQGDKVKKRCNDCGQSMCGEIACRFHAWNSFEKINTVSISPMAMPTRGKK